MITIDQLLESVDLDFEPRFVTKDEDGTVSIWEKKPEWCDDFYRVDANNVGEVVMCPKLKLSEFVNKHWTECIYEVPRKTIGKIEKLVCYELADEKFNPTGKFEPMCYMTLIQTINALVDAVNELKGAKND